MSLECLNDYDLKKHTTFKIGGKAKRTYFPETSDELITLLEKLRNPIVLGGCSNVLISSNGVDSDVILTNRLDNFEFNHNKVTAQCGVRIPILSKSAQKLGLSGFEFMACFPGTVGGVVCMNASAHGQFVSDTCISCRVFDLDEKKVLHLEKSDLKFSYRSSVLSEKNYILLDTVFELKKDVPEKILSLMKKNIEFRKEKQPGLSLPNAGSIFKNPDGDSAGRLLEEAGARGLNYGGARVWDGHCNFIVNENNAQSKDVSYLMNKMYNMVKEKSGIKLEPEIRYIGNPDREEEELWDTILKKS